MFWSPIFYHNIALDSIIVKRLHQFSEIFFHSRFLMKTRRFSGFYFVLFFPIHAKMPIREYFIPTEEVFPEDNFFTVFVL